MTCATASCAYTAYVPLGSSYTASATLTGYQTQTDNSITLDTAGPTATFSATLVVEDHEVCVAAQSNTTPPLAAPTTATVTLTGVTGDGKYGTTNCATGFDFTGVAPGTHTATATFDGFTLSGTFSVPIEDTSNDPVLGTASGSFAQVNGSVTLNPVPGTATTVTITFCTNATSTASCTGSEVGDTTVQVDTANSTATFSAFIPANVQGMDVSAAGYTDSGVVALAVSDGKSVTPGLVTLDTPPPPPPPTTTTTAPPTP
jgi:hypothetical protein